MMKRTQLLSLLLALMFASTYTSFAASSSRLQLGLAGSMRDVSMFRSTGSFSYLSKAMDALYSSVYLPSIAPSDYTSARRQVVKAWVQILVLVQGAYDPTFNPEDIPVNCLYPPTQRGGKAIGKCNDYQDILDPTERAAFKKQVEANSLLAQQELRYGWVIRLERQALSQFKVDLQQFQGVPPDTSALGALVERSSLTTDRKEKLLAIITQPLK